MLPRPGRARRDRRAHRGRRAASAVARPDLVLLNDDDLTYAKIRLDPQSLAAVTESIGELPRHAGPLAVLVGGLGHDPRRGDVGHRLRHAGAATASRSETDSSVVRTLLRQAETTVILYSAPERRDEARLRLADGLRAADARARRPAATRSCSSSAPSPARRPPTSSSTTCGRCSTAAQPVDGLTIDTDLRWHLLHQLVAAGKAGRQRDRPRARPRRHRDRTPAGGRRARRPAAPGGEGGGVVVGHGQRRPAQRDPDRGDRRLRPRRPAGAAAALRRAATSPASPTSGRSAPTRPRRTS